MILNAINSALLENLLYLVSVFTNPQVVILHSSCEIMGGDMTYGYTKFRVRVLEHTDNMPKIHT